MTRRAHEPRYYEVDKLLGNVSLMKRTHKKNYSWSPETQKWSRMSENGPPSKWPGYWKWTVLTPEEALLRLF